MFAQDLSIDSMEDLTYRARDEQTPLVGAERGVSFFEGWDKAPSLEDQRFSSLQDLFQEQWEHHTRHQ